MTEVAGYPTDGSQAAAGTEGGPAGSGAGAAGSSGSGGAAKARGQRKVREGVVVSDKMDKTVVVEVARTVMHPLFKKTLVRTRRVKAHDEHNECRVGDRVLIMETRPLSKEKRWRVVRIVERAR